MAHDHGHGHEHAHDHDHDHEHEEASDKITIFHATSPACHWSWGFEPVLNRMRMVYGDQIDVRLLIGCPYEDWNEWQEQYGMKEDEALEWMESEVKEFVGLPIQAPHKGSVPKTVMPASLAVMAAVRQGDDRKAERFLRGLMRMYAVEAKDPTKSDVLRAAATEAALDVKRFEKDMQDEKGLREAIDSQGEGFPHVPLGFYNLAISDNQGRIVLIDHAFHPGDVEDAIDYLSAGTLKKAAPRDVGAYLKQHGFAPALEIARVFDIPEEKAAEELAALEKAGKAKRATLAGAPHWTAA